MPARVVLSGCAGRPPGNIRCHDHGDRDRRVGEKKGGPPSSVMRTLVVSLDQNPVTAVVTAVAPPKSAIRLANPFESAVPPASILATPSGVPVSATDNPEPLRSASVTHSPGASTSNSRSRPRQSRPPNSPELHATLIDP